MTDDRVFSKKHAPLEPWWDRLLEVLIERGAHRTVEAFAPGLSYGEIEAVLAASGIAPGTVRGQILNLFRCSNGFKEGRWTRLFPDVDLLSLQDMISVRKMMLEVVGVSSGYSSYAGYPAYGFVPEYIPFAERDGYLLVTDMRAGSSWGEVLKYDKVSADEDPKKWTSLTYLFDELIAAIANGSEFDGWTADVIDGELIWDLEGGP